MSDTKNLFEDENLYQLALTHKSWVNENKNTRESNERLEFLGDAILEFVVSKELYRRHPDKEEGYLTTLRSNLVNTTNLARLSKQLSLGEKLYLSKGEEETGGRNNDSLLANTVEAIIGALYLDGGIEKAEKFILDNLSQDIEDFANKPLKDAKSRLQEEVQSSGLMAPKYEVVNEIGPDHNKVFTVRVTIDGKPVAEGSGKNKAIAEQDAAAVALKTLGENA